MHTVDLLTLSNLASLLRNPQDVFESGPRRPSLLQESDQNPGKDQDTLVETAKQTQEKKETPHLLVFVNRTVEQSLKGWLRRIGQRFSHSLVTLPSK